MEATAVKLRDCLHGTIVQLLPDGDYWCLFRLECHPAAGGASRLGTMRRFAYLRQVVRTYDGAAERWTYRNVGKILDWSHECVSVDDSHVGVAGDVFLSAVREDDMLPVGLGEEIDGGVNDIAHLARREDGTGDR